MSDAPIVVFDPMPAEPAAHRVREGVYLHNVAKTGLDEYAPVGFFLRNPRGETLGGLLGSIWGGWLHITHLWVSQGARGAGHGARLLADAEAYAKEKSCFAATLETHSFQARPFYEKRGYDVFAELPDFPLEHAKYFMRKNLV